MKAAIKTPIDQLNDLLDRTAAEHVRERWRGYFEPVPGLSEGLPVPIFGIMVLIWQLREKELKQKYPLDDAGSRLDFIAWCLVHGGREYQSLREADAFWEALGKPASFPGGPLPSDDPGHGISWLMVLLLRQRGDLSIDLSTVQGRKQLLAWYILHGQKELPFVQRPFQPWQTDYLFAESGMPGLNRLHLLMYQAIPHVQKSFPLPAARQQYLGWLRNYLCVDTKLVKNLCAQWASIDSATGIDRHSLPDVAQDPAARAPGVNVIGYIHGQLGIGEDARMAARSLLSTTVPFTLIDFPPGKEIPQNDRSMAAHVTPDGAYSTNLFCLTALEQGRCFAERGIKQIEGRYNIGYWPWELPKFPTQWRHLISLVDEIWVASEHIRKGLDGDSLVPVPVPVRVMPMAVEMTEVSHKNRSDFGLPPKAKLFIFAFDLQSSAKRKNPIACVTAFRKAFPLKGKKALGAEQVGLVVKVHPLDQHDADWEMLKQLQAEDPRIHLMDQTLSKADLMALYKACDCFVSLHRAEGFGRGIAEAMLLGKPVITTGFSGNLEFTNENNALLVKHTLIPVAAGDYLHGEGQVWADADVTHAAAQMLLVVNETRSVEQLAARGHETVATNHDVKRVGKQYEAVLRKTGAFAAPSATSEKSAPSPRKPSRRRVALTD
ncbi:glycosyltransferase [Lacisediminimonas profundi]|uniref:glycosyltransferase n=1 Tax=Lacisediminimonas profundi TaxID=2603856 RepID=UPI00124BAF13|nr:glycosyltransferase [Lacisediminimonas profundi]